MTEQALEAVYAALADEWAALQEQADRLALAEAGRAIGQQLVDESPKEAV